jgi:hypothetical protein
MIEIVIDEKYNSFIEEYSKKLDLGGYSNLNKTDLGKSSRRDFQKTGLFCELSWNLHRYGNIDLMHSRLDNKLEHYKKSGKGDNGVDDTISYQGKERIIDIKGSHCQDAERIKYLNLIIPQRERHENQKMIFIAAFTIGTDRSTIDKVVLAGWTYGEDVVSRWRVDESKWAVEVRNLSDMKELEKFIR